MISRIQIFFLFLLSISNLYAQQTLDLSGNWQVKIEEENPKTVSVPGLAGNPSKMEKMVYSRKVVLPEGNWNLATLILNGARFDPTIFINGQRIAEQEGGMAPLQFIISHPDLKPGKTVNLEIHLKALSEIKVSNASRIPEADRWRSNVSSCLWDKVEMLFSTSARISLIQPRYIPENDTIQFLVHLDGLLNVSKSQFQLELQYGKNRIILIPIIASQNNIQIKIKRPASLPLWTPDSPDRMNFTFLVKKKNQILDQQNLIWAPKDFRVKDKKFLLNNRHFQARAVTVVWHRWVRDAEGQQLAWDTTWFKNNIILRSKSLGANTLRFHLGTPPEVFLELCDRYGMAVQLEWLFFHGMKANQQSLENQWRSWLDLAMKHPSVILIHPWNETEGKELETAWFALNKILPDYPPLVLAERNVLHLHKYWWSMFENLGLYYDGYQQFPKAVMADEFGGNYLDGKNKPGGYKTLKESFLRFLGPNATEQDRAEIHLLSNTRIAEYWRRLEVAGFSPFCALGSWEDGNHWFLDSLKTGKPKPVWEGLRAAFSPQTISLEIWDRNFMPTQEFSCPLHFFNDAPDPLKMKALLCLFDSTGKRIWADTVRQKVGAFGHETFPVEFMMPDRVGRFTLKAILVNGKDKVPESVWSIRILNPTRFGKDLIKVSTLEGDKELIQFKEEYFPEPSQNEKKNKEVLICKSSTYQSLSIQKKDSIENRIRKGMNVVFTDAGPQWLGAGYEDESLENAFQAQPVVKVPKQVNQIFTLGVKINFTQTAEPESHIHPNSENSSLWKGLQHDYGWLWNGYRGGLITPSANMDISGLGGTALKALWQKRGADTSQIKNGLVAYELQGFYAFSNKRNDSETRKKLKEKVAFLVADAPALQASVNPNAPILESDLKIQIASAGKAEGTEILVLSVCGKNLVRTPVVQIGFGLGKGKMMVSQLLMEGRLAPSFQDQNVYAVRKDPVAIQMLINMVESIAKH